jgi:hypothetical protein
MRSAVRSTLWPWVKVLLCLAALDWALFGGGALFFRAVPELPRFPVTWGLLYRCVQRIALPPEAPRAYAVGSSISSSASTSGAWDGLAARGGRARSRRSRSSGRRVSMKR